MFILSTFFYLIGTQPRADGSGDADEERRDDATVHHGSGSNNGSPFFFCLPTKQNKTKQNKTKQNKTKQNKTKQNETKRTNETKRNETKRNETKRKRKQNKSLLHAEAHRVITLWADPESLRRICTSSTNRTRRCTGTIPRPLAQNVVDIVLRELRIIMASSCMPLDRCAARDQGADELLKLQKRRRRKSAPNRSPA